MPRETQPIIIKYFSGFGTFFSHTDFCKILPCSEKFDIKHFDNFLDLLYIKHTKGGIDEFGNCGIIDSIVYKF
jgi:hypothetical protein